MSPEERLIRFMLGHMAAGIAAGFVFGAALIASNVAGLRDLLFASPEGWLFAILFFMGLSVTFGSLAMGVAIMLDKKPPD
jgi:predicted phage tail protein